MTWTRIARTDDLRGDGPHAVSVGVATLKEVACV